MDQFDPERRQDAAKVKEIDESCTNKWSWSGIVYRIITTIFRIFTMMNDNGRKMHREVNNSQPHHSQMWDNWDDPKLVAGSAKRSQRMSQTLKQLYAVEAAGINAESPVGKMYLNRTKDPMKAAQALINQKRLVELISEMKDEDSWQQKEILHLLKNGVDPSVPDYNLSLYYAGKNFMSPIHYSVRRGFQKTAEMLLQHGANPDVLDRYSVTPAHIAADVGTTKCLKKLLEYGANINVHTQPFRKPSRLDFIPDPVISEKTLEPEEFSFTVLPYEVGSTPLHLAAKGNHNECVKLLIDHGADYNATDEKGQTSLFLAAQRGLPDCVMTQLRSAVGFPILSIPTKRNDTALHECLRNGEKMTECIKELVRRGADVGLHNHRNESAVHLALHYKWNMDTIQFLILEGYGMDFDRQTERTPLAQILYGERRRHNPGEEPERHVLKSRDEQLAVFFLRMGAARRNLKEMLLHELNREEVGGALLETLMDSFEYLPPLSELGSGNSQNENERLFYSSSDEEDMDFDMEWRQPWDLFPDFSRNQVLRVGEVQRLNNSLAVARRRSRARIFHRRHRYWSYRMRMMHDEFGVGFENIGRRRPVDNARGPAPQLLREFARPLALEKRKQYMDRCKEIPSLAHLSRSVIRKTLKADVRKVISFPIPTSVKEYILLGHKLSTSDQVHERSESAPADESPEEDAAPISDQE